MKKIILATLVITTSLFAKIDYMAAGGGYSGGTLSTVARSGTFVGGSDNLSATYGSSIPFSIVLQGAVNFEKVFRGTLSIGFYNAYGDTVSYTGKTVNDKNTFIVDEIATFNYVWWDTLYAGGAIGYLVYESDVTVNNVVYEIRSSGLGLGAQIGVVFDIKKIIEVDAGFRLMYYNNSGNGKNLDTNLYSATDIVSYSINQWVTVSYKF